MTNETKTGLPDEIWINPVGVGSKEYCVHKIDHDMVRYVRADTVQKALAAYAILQAHAEEIKALDEAGDAATAATDPQTIRALIDEVERLRGLLSEAKETLEFCETDFKQFYGDDCHERSTLGYIRKNIKEIKKILKGQINE